MDAVQLPAVATEHHVWLGDARRLHMCADESAHLVCASPPYGALVRYESAPGQLGEIDDVEDFLGQMSAAIAESYRILVPGGRLVYVVGNICRSRRSAGRHHVIPLASHLDVLGCAAGFDALTGIKWLKISNARLEQGGSRRFLGKPNQPGGVVKNDLEHVLIFRKPGGYRSPADCQVQASHITTDDYARWFSPVWTGIPGARRSGHPAPYPVEIPYRLCRMFSFVGDVVVDPFGGTGTTALAAMAAGRHSVSVDVVASYVELASARIAAGAADLDRRGAPTPTVVEHLHPAPAA